MGKQLFGSSSASLVKTVFKRLPAEELRQALTNRATVPPQNPLGKAQASSTQQGNHPAHELAPLAALKQRGGMFP